MGEKERRFSNRACGAAGMGLAQLAPAEPGSRLPCGRRIVPHFQLTKKETEAGLHYSEAGGRDRNPGLQGPPHTPRMGTVCRMARGARWPAPPPARLH